MSQKFPRITIRHNHGLCILENAQLVDRGVYKSPYGGEYPQRYLVGVCVGGGETSRLFHAVSHTPYKRGEVREVEIYGREPRQYGDQWEVDITFCG